MATRQPKLKRVPLGKPLPPVVEDIPAPTQQELDLLIANWNAYAPPKYRGMLEARPVGTDDPKALWFYNPIRRRYIHARNGRIVTVDELRKAFLSFQDAMSKR
jgi:hypothetical protein